MHLEDKTHSGVIDMAVYLVADLCFMRVLT